MDEPASLHDSSGSSRIRTGHILRESSLASRVQWRRPTPFALHGTRSEQRAARYVAATNHDCVRQACDHAGCRMTWQPAVSMSMARSCCRPVCGAFE